MTDAEGNEIGKLFIGGLSQATNNGSLRLYFSRFGEVDDAVVMMDNKTGRSRGFGYVKYRDSESVTLALGAKPHVLDGKEVDAKQCNVNMKGRNRRSLKIFVGGIGLDQDAESIKNYFRQFGRVTDVNLMMDSNKQRHRGFAFVGFEDESVVKRLINTHYVTMNNKQVEIKAMEPPNFNRKMVSTSCVGGATHGDNACGHLFDNIADTSQLIPTGLSGFTTAVPYASPSPAYLSAQASALPCAQHQALAQQQQSSILTAFGGHHGNFGGCLLPDNLFQQTTFIQPTSNQYPVRISSEPIVHSVQKTPMPLLLTGGQFHHSTPLGNNAVGALNNAGSSLYATIPCHIVPSEYVAHPQQNTIAGTGQLINIERAAVQGWQAAGVPSAHLAICTPPLATQPSLVTCSQYSPNGQSNSPGVQHLSANNPSSGALLSPSYATCPQYTTMRSQHEQIPGTTYLNEPQNQGSLALSTGVVACGISSTQPGAGDTVLQTSGKSRGPSPTIDSKAEVSNTVPTSSSARIIYPTLMMTALGMPGSTVAASNTSLSVGQPLWNSTAPSFLYSPFPVGWATQTSPQSPSMQPWESTITLLPQQCSVPNALTHSGSRIPAQIAPTVETLPSDARESVTNTIEVNQISSTKASGDSSEREDNYANKDCTAKVSGNQSTTYPFVKKKLDTKGDNNNQVSRTTSKEMKDWALDTPGYRSGLRDSTALPTWQNSPVCIPPTSEWGGLLQENSNRSINRSMHMHHQQSWTMSLDASNDSSANREVRSIPTNPVSKGAGLAGSRTSENLNQHASAINSDGGGKADQSLQPHPSSRCSRLTQPLSKCEHQTSSHQLDNHELRHLGRTSPSRSCKMQSPTEENSAQLGKSKVFAVKASDSRNSVISESTHHRENGTRMGYTTWMYESHSGPCHMDSSNGGDTKDIQPNTNVSIELECHGPAGAAGDFHRPVHSSHFTDYKITR